MISDVYVDFTLFEKVLLDVIKSNYKLLTLDENTSFQLLYEEYKKENSLNSAGHVYNKEKLYNFYKEKCLSCAKYDLKHLSGEDLQRVQKEEREGILFTSSVFSYFLQQLHLEARLLKKDWNMAIKIITQLKICNLPKNYYFCANEETLNQLFSYGIKLYLTCSYKADCHDINTASIAKSMRQLLRIKDFAYEIKNGDIYFSEEAYAKLQAWLEQEISQIGGIYFLQKLFVMEIKPKYKSTIKRYLIHRDVRQLERNIDECRIPYNYLIQIGIKHLANTGSKFITLEGKWTKYENIISAAKHFLNILNLQSYSMFAEMLIDYKNIPVKISKSIFFDTMYMPIQYRTDFVLFYLEHVYIPFIDGDKAMGYTGQELLALCKYLFASDKDFCRTYSLKELMNGSQVPYSSLIQILKDMAWEACEVNKHFSQFMEKTNYKFKPFVKLTGEDYFFFSPCFNGFSFCEAIYEKLKAHGIPRLDKEKGIYIENMIKKLFTRKGFLFHSGHYIADKTTKTNYECDMVLETEKYIVFLEIKNQPLPDSFEQGADIDVLGVLGQGMVFSQMQCYRHMYYLQKNGQLVLTEKGKQSYTLYHNDRRIIRVSICSQEYQFLTNKTFSSKLLQSLLIANYSTHDIREQNKLDKLNKMQKELTKLVKAPENTMNDQRHAFHNSLFRTAQQLYSMMEVSQTLDEFVECLTESVYVSIGEGDAYCQILNCVERKMPLSITDA